MVKPINIERYVLLLHLPYILQVDVQVYVENLRHYEVPSFIVRPIEGFHLLLQLPDSGNSDIVFQLLGVSRSGVVVAGGLLKV